MTLRSVLVSNRYDFLETSQHGKKRVRIRSSNESLCCRGRSATSNNHCDDRSVLNVQYACVYWRHGCTSTTNPATEIFKLKVTSHECLHVYKVTLHCLHPHVETRLRGVTGHENQSAVTTHNFKIGYTTLARDPPQKLTLAARPFKKSPSFPGMCRLSTVLTTDPRPEPATSTPHPELPNYLRLITVLSSHCGLCVHPAPFLHAFPPKFCTHLSSCTPHHSVRIAFRHSIALVKFGEHHTRSYKVFIYCGLLSPPPCSRASSPSACILSFTRQPELSHRQTAARFRLSTRQSSFLEHSCSEFQRESSSSDLLAAVTFRSSRMLTARNERDWRCLELRKTLAKMGYENGSIFSLGFWHSMLGYVEVHT